ncbi:MAG: hypothetical protein ACK45R_03380 [Candidatus Kapaibacterium sp.]
MNNISYTSTYYFFLQHPFKIHEDSGLSNNTTGRRRLQTSTGCSHSEHPVEEKPMLTDTVPFLANNY